MSQNYHKVTEGICKTQATVIVSFLFLNSFNDDKEDYRGSSQVQKTSKEPEMSTSASVTAEWTATNRPDFTLFSQVAT